MARPILAFADPQQELTFLRAQVHLTRLADELLEDRLAAADP